MPTPRSRYRPAAAPDYSHRFHAGNVGDVWKHCVLVEVLGRVAAERRYAHYLETHAGEGRYALGPTGEWREGIGRLWAANDAAADPAVGRYVALCRRLAGDGARPASYPGSPMLARAVLGTAAQLTLWEHDPDTCARLAQHVRGDARVRLVPGDGLAALPGALGAARARGEGLVVLIDPPWVQKADWTAVPDALAAAVRAAPRACVLLWYPVKSLTRPNAMLARLAAAGVPGTIVELVTTPLEERHRRLNGSGMLLVSPPAGTVEAVAAAAAALGPRCATRPGVWSCRLRAWAGGGTAA